VAGRRTHLTDTARLARWHLGADIHDLFNQDNGAFWYRIRNSTLNAGLGSIAEALIATACGYAIAKLDFPGRPLPFACTPGRSAGADHRTAPGQRWRGCEPRASG
jgi:ABC-type glycerol-3-phosphate transport system permease component